MDPFPLVSIIIPCWNAERFVGGAIESALAQTYKNIEIIVVDDGSTDGTLAAIRSYGQQIRYLTGPNRGGGAARNRGLETARGDVLQFLDADDRLHVDKIWRQVQLINVHGRDSVFCSAWVAPIESPTDGHEWPHSDDPDPVCAALGSNAGTSVGLHARKLVEVAGGFDESLPCAQERDFHLRLACLGSKWGVLQAPLVTELRRADSVSADHCKVLAQYELIVQRARRILEGRGEWSTRRARAAAGFLARAAAQYARFGRYERAAHYISVATSHQDSTLWRLAGRLGHLGLPLASSFGPRVTERMIAALARCM